MGYKQVISAIHTQREVALHKDTNTQSPRWIVALRETMVDRVRRHRDVTTLCREWSFSKGFFMSSFTEILSKGKKENSTALFPVTIVDFLEFPKLQQKTKMANHLALYKQLGTLH